MFPLPNSYPDWINIKEQLIHTDALQFVEKTIDFKLNIRTLFEEKFFQTVNLALQIDELFPHGNIPLLRRGENKTLEFTRLQIACILSHMFLCTLKKQSHNTYW